MQPHLSEDEGTAVSHFSPGGQKQSCFIVDGVDVDEED